MPKGDIGSSLPGKLSRSTVPDKFMVLLIVGLHALEVGLGADVLLAVDDEGSDVEVIGHVEHLLADTGGASHCLLLIVDASGISYYLFPLSG